MGERYHVQRVIAQGGMGTVYLARDRKHANRAVALKVLRPEIAEGAAPYLAVAGEHALERFANGTLDSFRRVAWRSEGVRISEAALQRIAQCRESFLQLIDKDPDLVIYGVTTGYGQRASRMIAGEERRSHAAG
jgi:serine/threonine protein kinase